MKQHKAIGIRGLWVNGGVKAGLNVVNFPFGLER